MKYESIGNVTYLWPKQDQQGLQGNDDQGAPGDEFLAELSLDEKKSLRRLESSMSRSWPPAKLKAKIAGLGFESKADQIYVDFQNRGLYDVRYAAEIELHRLLQKGQGEHRVKARFFELGFDEDLTASVLADLTDDDWFDSMLVVSQAMSKAESQKGTETERLLREKLQEKLKRRGFSFGLIQRFFNMEGRNV